MLEYSVSARRLDSHSSEATSERRLELLHQNVRRYGTVFNTVAPGTELSGTLRRA